MWESCSTLRRLGEGGSVRRRDLWGCVGALLTSLLLARGSPALADERFSLRVEHPRPDFNSPFDRPAFVPAPFALPADYQRMGVPEIKTFPSGDFRPRGHSVQDDPQPSAVSESAPMLRGSTVWQRLRDFRSHGRVRLLTLWETGGSSVSLQAGKKGEPSLQWTSRSMNRGGATRGVFDQMFSVSLAGAGRNLHFPARAAAPEVTTNPAKLSDVNSKK